VPSKKKCPKKVSKRNSSSVPSKKKVPKKVSKRNSSSVPSKKECKKKVPKKYVKCALKRKVPKKRSKENSSSVLPQKKSFKEVPQVCPKSKKIQILFHPLKEYSITSIRFFFFHFFHFFLGLEPTIFKSHDVRFLIPSTWFLNFEYEVSTHASWASS